MTQRSNRDHNLSITSQPKAAGGALGNGTANSVPPDRVPAPALAAKPLGTGKTRPPERFWLEAVVVRASRLVGSLQVAVFLLVLFAIVLMSGTIVESWYDGKVAQQLVYRTWWFTTLLALLGANIFCAAAKKWPWKKYQTGFLITHVGLLTMLAGGIWNSLSGTDALMVVIDTKNREYSDRYGGDYTTSKIIDRDVSEIRVARPHKSKDETREYPFEPGPLAWRADEYLRPKVDWLPALLNAVTHPLPPSWERDLGDGARLEILAFYPTVRKEKFGPARPGDTDTFPAIKLQLASAKAGMALPEDWVACQERARDLPLGPGLVQFLGRDCPADLVKEFGNPPPPADVGTKGQLVLFLGGKKYPIDVEQASGKTGVPLGDNGLKVSVTDYIADFTQPDSQAPENPALKFELANPEGEKASFAVVGRLAGQLFPIPRSGNLLQCPGDLQAWYHSPDYRWGNASVRGLLQFVTGKDGKLYYRAFNSHEGSFHFEKTGVAEEGPQRYPIWQGMNWKFRIAAYVPNAVGPPYFIPEDRRPGIEDEETPPGIRCRLTVGKDSKEFWLLKTDASMSPVVVGKEAFQVGYNTHQRSLDFKITLLRAEQTSDPGTGNPASYSSYVLLTDDEQHINGEPRVITMNQPLDHRDYKVFQSGYLSLGLDEYGKPVNRSVFTVSRDPGLILKYIGSSMLALGIACMFYMKAYFFKPRGRPRSTPKLAPGAGTQES